MYHSSVALLFSTLSALSFSSLVNALPADAKGRVFARETDYSPPGVDASTTASAPVSTAAAVTTKANSSASSFPLAATLGIIVGGVIVVFVTLGLLVWYFRRRNSRRGDDLVLKADEPESITRKPTISTASSDSGRALTSQGTLHTLNTAIISPTTTRSPPPMAQVDPRRSMSATRQSTYNPNAYGRYPAPPGLQGSVVPPVPSISVASPPEEGRSFISRPITLLPPAPKVIPAGITGPGAARHYMLESGTVGGQSTRHARRETLSEDTVSAAFGLRSAAADGPRPFPSLVKA